MAAEIVLRAVGKSYGDGAGSVTAIRDISFQVSPGEFCTILGPSGCGKSTIINLVAGFIFPSAGEVLVDGATVRAPGSDRAVVTQDYSLFEWKTVCENVEFGLKARGAKLPARRDIAMQHLNTVHLTEFADKYPAELSGGMRQRLALVRALAVEPACLLLDEPLAALDLQMRKTLQDELLRVWRLTGKTFLLVTHDVGEALYLSDRIFLMGARPGHILDTLNVPFPRPRLPALRGHESFQACVQEVSGYLESGKQSEGFA